MTIKLKAAMDLKAGQTDEWILQPVFIKRVRPADYEEIIRRSRVPLSHDSWPAVQEAARELSDVGGIETVAIVRRKSHVTVNSIWRDGAQVASSVVQP